MKKYMLLMIISVLISSCGTISENKNLYTQETIATVESLMPTTMTVTTLTPTQEDLICIPSIEKVADSVRLFSWSLEENFLYYTQDRDQIEWEMYPNHIATTVQSVFPVLNDQLIELTEFSNILPHDYSLSPSGKKMIYWQSVYTRPTPTSSGGEVSPTEYEWILDIYLVKEDTSSSRFITQVEGEIIDAYWSVDERYVFLLFNQLQLPGDNFVIRIDLEKDSQEVIFPDLQGKMYNNWVALSPNQDWIAVSFRKESPQVQLFNLISEQTQQINNLPEFDRLYWLQKNIWLLINNSESDAKFTLFDISTKEILGSYTFDNRVEFLTYNQAPQLSPTHNQLAFFSINPITNEISLFIFSLCTTL